VGQLLVVVGFSFIFNENQNWSLVHW